MAVKYDAQARETGACIVSACGFGSLINELGVLYLRNHFRGGVVSHAESYAKFTQTAGYTGNAG